ncbi:MAG TPA: hypothetical protein VIN08_06580 [Ohtaekwangia sp.]|uniref:SMP-30/gluconolactonase/LRE family protein n=1 Tax=Ohtaekwangia sp. TaxID=2066019 RepID=UPI002F93C892
MKRYCFLFLYLLAEGLLAQQKPEIAFTIEEKDLIPEGIAYNAVDKSFYVSSINKRKIITISADGKVSDLIASGDNEIEQVLGMKVDAKGFLWACNNTPEHDTVNRISNVHVYDLRTKKMVMRFKLVDDRLHLFNDLYITKAGDVFITDTQASMLWVVRKDSKTLEEFTKPGSLTWANGITASQDEKFLLVSTTGPLGIAMVDTQTKAITPLLNDRYMMMGFDGLYRYNNTLIGVQNTFFPESIQKIVLTPDNKRAEKIDFLCERDALFNSPTTGVVADGYFYFIANSQLLQIIGNQGKIKEPEKLNDTFIMKIKLSEAY